jgi:hypothetical protein
VLRKTGLHRAQRLLVIATPAVSTPLTLAPCPLVLILPTRPALLGLEERSLLDFGLGARNHRFPVVPMLLGFPQLPSLGFALGPLVLDPPRAPFLGFAPEPLVFGLPPRLALRCLSRQTLGGLLLCLLVGKLAPRPPFLGVARQTVVFGLPLRLALRCLSRQTLGGVLRSRPVPGLGGARPTLLRALRLRVIAIPRRVCRVRLAILAVRHGGFPPPEPRPFAHNRGASVLPGARSGRAACERCPQ